MNPLLQIKRYCAWIKETIRQELRSLERSLYPTEEEKENFSQLGWNLSPLKLTRESGVLKPLELMLKTDEMIHTIIPKMNPTLL